MNNVEEFAFNLEDMLFQIGLPKQYFSGSFVIAEKFKEEIARFSSLLNHCIIVESQPKEKSILKEELHQVIKSVKSTSKIILDIFKNYENMDYKKTQLLMDQLLNELKDSIFIGSVDGWVKINNMYINLKSGKTHRFFRIRTVDNTLEKIADNKYELFHIPLNKRAFSNNDRFSLAGFPCLYLSTQLELSWLECSCPQKYYYSQFQYKYKENPNLPNSSRNLNQELKCLMLYTPQEICLWGNSIKYNDYSLWIRVITRYLKNYPLVLACSFVNQGGQVPFKQEYILPQMLMQWVQRNNHIVQGIEYSSCVDPILKDKGWNANNLVIPALPPYDENQYSIPLKQYFAWSDPVYYEIPVFDRNYNEKDRKFIYDFLECVNSTLQKELYPRVLIDFMQKIRNTGSYLLKLLENESINMDLTLGILQSISDNIHSIETTYNLSIKNMTKQDITEWSFNDVDEQKFKILLENVNQIYNQFTGDQNAKTIEKIVKNYINLIWN